MSEAIKLKLTEIFYSLQGEANTVGLPTVFVRLTGCPLRCQYCDTEYAFTGGENWQLEDIVAEVKKYNTKYVTVTGGEPLAQKRCIDLLERLCDEAYKVSLETSGALDVSAVDSRVSKVMDIKTPGSKEEAKNRWQNLDFITPHDQLKFVITSRDDYDWARQKVTEYLLTDKCEVFFSPSKGQCDATELANWILADQLQVRMQLQLHKILWGDVPGK